MENSSSHPVVSRDAWIKARKRHLRDEKAFTRLRDRLSADRRALPWVKVEKDYKFIGEAGPVSLSEAFGAHSQLIVYHFMYGPDWEQGCPSCSFWIDNLDGIVIHLNQRDAAFVVIAHAHIDQLLAFRDRMGWTCCWLSALDSDFNYDYHVSFAQEGGEKFANFERKRFKLKEVPGISVFYKHDEREIFHTYSTYSRGLDMLNGAYHYMDLLPKGRNETRPIMDWLRHHDSY